jgi:hypothetical protein
VPTVRCRLAKARQRLRDRLTRRGFAAPALAAALARNVTSAAIPPALIRSTVLAATAGPALAGAALLTHAILREMLMTKIKFATTAALTALALASTCVIVAGARQPDDPEPPRKTTARAPDVKPEQPVPEKPLETVEIKGRVVAAKRPAGHLCRGDGVLHRRRRRPVAQDDQRLRWAIFDPSAQGRT